MKKLVYSLALVVLSAASVLAGGEGWSSDAKAALETAKKDKKLVLMDFTGSDWCGWCIKLNKEVFSQKEFKDYASTNLVLLELDFPNEKKLSDAVKKQNEELKKKHEVSGFPTLVLTDAEGKVIWKQVGYLAGGPKAFIEAIESAKKPKL